VSIQVLCITIAEILKQGGNKKIMAKKIIAKQFSWKLRDLSRGLIMAVLTPAVLILQQSLESGILTFNWKEIAMASVAGGFAYLVKNFFEPTKTIERL
jgi:hypothetical protein